VLRRKAQHITAGSKSKTNILKCVSIVFITSFYLKDYENKCKVLEGNVGMLESAIKEKNKEIVALQKDLNCLLTTMAKAQSSGPVHLSGIALSATEHNSPLEGLVVQSQTQVRMCSVYSVVCCSVV